MAIIDTYLALILNGSRNIDTIMKRYREAVLKELTALGLDGFGNLLEA